MHAAPLQTEKQIDVFAAPYGTVVVYKDVRYVVVEDYFAGVVTLRRLKCLEGDSVNSFLNVRIPGTELYKNQ